MSELKPKRERKTTSVSSEKSAKNAEKPNTREVTFQLFKQGLDVSEIATQRNLAISTIEGHFLPYLENGDIFIDDLLDKEKQKIIREALDANPDETSSSVIKNQLPDDITFAQIRYMMIEKRRNEL